MMKSCLCLNGGRIFFRKERKQEAKHAAVLRENQSYAGFFVDITGKTGYYKLA